MSYMSDWLDWTSGRKSDAEIIARCHVDPFFKRWFEARRSALVAERDRPSARGAPPARDSAGQNG